MNWKTALKYIAFLAIGVVLFYLAFANVDNKAELWAHMKSAEWWGIGASFLMGYAAIISRGLRWKILLQPLGHAPKAGHSIHAVAFSYFANTFVPRSGELARCGALNQTDDIPVDQLFGTVISERVIDFAILLMLTLTAVLGNLSAFNLLLADMQLPSGTGLIPFAVAGLAVAVGAYVFRNALVQIPFVDRVFAFLQGVLAGLTSIRHMERKGAFLAHTFFIWAMYFLMTYVIFLSIEAVSGISLLNAVFIMVAGGFGMVLPAPGGIGSYQWAVTLAFVALGFTEELGLAVANVVWLTQTAMTVGMGGIGYLMLMWYRLRKDRLAQEAAANADALGQESEAAQ